MMAGSWLLDGLRQVEYSCHVQAWWTGVNNYVSAFGVSWAVVDKLHRVAGNMLMPMTASNEQDEMHE